MFIRDKNEGFSLIEVALGLIILGIAVGTMTNTYFVFRQHQLRVITLQNAQEIQDALQKYVLNNGAYPAPADPGLNSANINFGVETALVMLPAPTIPLCAGGDTVVCRTPAAAGTGGSGQILIGDVPFATLGLPAEFMLDVRGRKLSYAVSANLTDKMVGQVGGPASFVNTGGAVTILDAAGVVSLNATPPVTVRYTTVPPCPVGGAPCNLPAAHYALVDHGKDGAGAFSLDGVLYAACPAAALDRENCNNDGTFNDGYAVTPLGYVRQEKSIAGAGHYDDYLYYTTTLTSDIWAKDASADILNNNSGNVKVGPLGGAGINVPQAALDVRGNVQADALQTNQLCDTSANSFGGGIYTNNPCAANASNQFVPAKLALTPGAAGNPVGITCAASGNGMHGIANGMAECADMAGDNQGQPLMGVNCPTGTSCCAGGQGPVGYDQNGNVVCQ